MKTIYWILIIVGAAILTVVATYLIQKQITKSSLDKRIMDNLNDASDSSSRVYKVKVEGKDVCAKWINGVFTSVGSPPCVD